MKVNKYGNFSMCSRIRMRGKLDAAFEIIKGGILDYAKLPAYRAAAHSVLEGLNMRISEELLRRQTIVRRAERDSGERAVK